MTELNLVFKYFLFNECATALEYHGYSRAVEVNEVEVNEEVRL